MNLNNDTALITGSSGGIGEEFAVQLARRGVNLVLVARRQNKLDQLRSRLLQSFPGLTVDVIAADLSVPGSAAELASQIGELGRRIDILINNAGIGLHGDFAQQKADENASQIQLNCTTLVELTALFLPAMVVARHGLIINVSSIAGFQPDPGMAVYGATKAFVLSFTEALWQETKSTGVRVLTLCPGATETEFFARTGEEFLTSGRQTPEQVVDTAMKAIDKTTPTVVSGWRNALLAQSYRFTPRRVMLQVSQRLVKAK
ncbi:SDR family oxidoreductase [Mycobacterium sp. 852002-40037_SCH5390672]|uniref:SDR family NAD(P)-dependent oxidoreductase n=1 Tax=Mycobacterium sp. 852002-40037_SCH5390672 TaxID=1834089 RepID=UPI000804A5A4|nr:SDR family oxidoreductase [Mycobacterium sp. 852002-40037_SCH5390672]OBB95565.1 oxidoreductase [Mycobacterium sp. 852002-40037_SCH5390672]